MFIFSYIKGVWLARFATHLPYHPSIILHKIAPVLEWFRHGMADTEQVTMRRLRVTLLLLFKQEVSVNSIRFKQLSMDNTYMINL